MDTIESTVREFTQRIEAIVDMTVRDAARDAVLAALEGRPSAKRNGTLTLIAKKPRRKGPIQLCPAPGCTGRAAPVFGMVCSAHKNAPKTTVAKWREARRAKGKNGVSKPSVRKLPRKKKTVTKKPPAKAAA